MYTACMDDGYVIPSGFLNNVRPHHLNMNNTTKQPQTINMGKLAKL